MIIRRLQADIIKSLSDFPVVGLVGSRQTGKTTLAKNLAKEHFGESVYLDLERPSDSHKLDEAELYLEQFKDRLVIIDEVQRKPDLFPLIRSMVDSNPGRHGRFALLGSASPDLIRQASESLAGRIIYHELSPFLLDETAGDSWRKLWFRGGYPLSYLADTEDNSNRWKEAFIRTYLEQDIPGLGFRTPAAQLRRFWEMVSHNHGQLWNANKLASSMGVSGPAIRRYLDLLQDTFVLRQLAPYHINTKKRLVKSPKVYVRDSGLLHSLLGIERQDLLLGSPHAGASWEGWVVEQIISPLPNSWPTYFYRTSAGAEIDLLIFPPGKAPIAIEIKLSLQPKLARGFHTAFADLGCKQGFVIYPGNEQYPLTKKVAAIPAKDIPKLVHSIISQ
jgi:uncharacterized protein